MYIYDSPRNRITEELFFYHGKKKADEASEQTAAKKAASVSDEVFSVKESAYTPPDATLLVERSDSLLQPCEDSDEVSEKIEEVFSAVRLSVNIVSAVRGAAAVRYLLKLSKKITARKLNRTCAELSKRLDIVGQVRMDFTGDDGMVFAEIPRKVKAKIALNEFVTSKAFEKHKGKAVLCVGKTIDGEAVFFDLEKDGNLLMAGSTAGGMNDCLDAMICGLLYNASPSDLRFILVDPQSVYFDKYSALPHLLTGEIITDTPKAVRALKWAASEVARRRKLFRETAAANIKEYNDREAAKRGELRLPNIAVVVDEIAELMLSPYRREIELILLSIGSNSFEAGVHLIFATRRTSVDVISSVVSDNFAAKIAFSVPSPKDSQNVLGKFGAETLTGSGDMLLLRKGEKKLKRVQGIFVSTTEIMDVLQSVKEKNTAAFNETAKKFMAAVEKAPVSKIETKKIVGEDELFKEVVRRVVQGQFASTSMIQRRFSMGYNRATKIMEEMEELGFIGPMEGVEPRKILITAEKFREFFGDYIESLDIFDGLVALGNRVKTVSDLDEVRKGLAEGRYDDLMKDVLRVVLTTGEDPSTTMIQRIYAVGYNRATKIIDDMESLGLVGPLDGGNPRALYATEGVFRLLYNEPL